MGSELRFDGRVAIVTGAGAGLGRSHALLLASRGAKVVVNDLGGTFDGEGSSQKAADTVVDEIKAAGGEAIPNYDSVEDGDAIVKTAMDEWGRVDILINNAGILRDVSFHKMKLEDWEKIYRVHVYGSFRVTHAAWPIMREQQFGRIIMTASAAGIYGNFGQANYSMAKLGLLGFGNTLAVEGRKRNILVNTIAPLAGSRLTETVLPKEMLDALKPEYVSPLVAVLCHEQSERTGGLYEVGGGYFAALRWERTKGKTFRVGRAITPETVEESWDTISSYDGATHPDSIAVSMQPVMQNVDAGPSKGGNQYIDVDAALGYEYPEVETSYDDKDLAIYALGVGAAENPVDENDLGYVYEMHGGGFKALPTYGVIPALNAFFKLATSGQRGPGLNFGLDRILHGEQYMELKRPLPRKSKLVHKTRVKEIWDKGKHALVVNETKSYDEDGNELVRNELTTLVRGAGGWGGDRGPSVEVNVPPDRKPDFVVEQKIPENQALLYRLSGDINPLHADPGFAKAFGFDKPILHGLCTFGYAARHVLSKTAPKGDSDYFKSIRVRFSDSVFPGETLVTEIWKESDTKVIFRTKVKERDSVVLSAAGMEYFTEIPKPKTKAKKKQAAKGAAAAPRMPISADLFNAIGGFVAANPEVKDRVKTVFQFKLTAPASTWTLDFKEGKVGTGELAKPQCTLAMSDADFMAMATGKSDPMKLFSSGALKISGDIMASQKLGFLKKITPEMVIAEMNKRLGSNGDAADAGAEDEATAGDAGGATPEPSTWDVFIAVRDHIERHPDLVGKVGKVFLFKITNPDAAWTIDVKNDKGAVHEGEVGKPDCTLQISESDMIDMTMGRSDPMKLFTTGKLKVTGDIMASQKLSFLQKMDPQKAIEAVARARAAGQGPKSAGGGGGASAGASAKAEAPTIFATLEKRLGDNPKLVEGLGGVVLITITDPDASWVIDGKATPPSVKSGTVEGADARLTLADADLALLAKGETTAQNLFQHGQLRVDGNMDVARQAGTVLGRS